MRIVVVKKTQYDSLPVAVKNEFSSLSDINKSIPLHSIGGVDYHVFGICGAIENSTYVKLFHSYSESEMSAILEADSIIYTDVDIYYEPQQLAFTKKTLPNGKKLYKRVHGSLWETIQPGTTASLQIEIGYSHVKMQGIEIIGCKEKGMVNFYIFDDDFGSYSGIPNYKLNQFGVDVNTPNDYYKKNSSYDADLYYGMVISIEYTNNSLVPHEVCFNAELNEVK